MFKSRIYSDGSAIMTGCAGNKRSARIRFIETLMLYQPWGMDTCTIFFQQHMECESVTEMLSYNIVRSLPYQRDPH